MNRAQDVVEAAHEPRKVKVEMDPRVRRVLPRSGVGKPTKDLKEVLSELGAVSNCHV